MYITLASSSKLLFFLKRNLLMYRDVESNKNEKSLSRRFYPRWMIIRFDIRILYFASGQDFFFNWDTIYISWIFCCFLSPNHLPDLFVFQMTVVTILQRLCACLNLLLLVRDTFYNRDSIGYRRNSVKIFSSFFSVNFGLCWLPNDHLNTLVFFNMNYGLP